MVKHRLFLAPSIWESLFASKPSQHRQKCMALLMMREKKIRLLPFVRLDVSCRGKGCRYRNCRSLHSKQMAKTICWTEAWVFLRCLTFIELWTHPFSQSESSQNGDFFGFVGSWGQALEKSSTEPWRGEDRTTGTEAPMLSPSNWSYCVVERDVYRYVMLSMCGVVEINSRI